MIKQLRKVGNSTALILDKAIMELIGLEENGDVQLAVSNGSLILTPVQPGAVRAGPLPRHHPAPRRPQAPGSMRAARAAKHD
jgi:antitoxin component of MazEF toxin-antitoxin module